jgi:hypothetical protein
MTRKKAKASDNRKRLWLLPLLLVLPVLVLPVLVLPVLVLPVTALAWKEFPALARYVKIARM